MYFLTPLRQHSCYLTLRIWMLVWVQRLKMLKAKVLSSPPIPHGFPKRRMHSSKKLNLRFKCQLTTAPVPTVFINHTDEPAVYHHPSVMWNLQLDNFNRKCCDSSDRQTDRGVGGKNASSWGPTWNTYSAFKYSHDSSAHTANPHETDTD